MTVTAPDDVYYDPYDVDINSDPYPAFKGLREEAPLYYNDQHDFYALSRFDDVDRGAGRPRDVHRPARGAILELIKANIEIPPGMLIFEDPPLHDIHRKLLSRRVHPAQGDRARAEDPRVLRPQPRSPGRHRAASTSSPTSARQMPMRVIGMLLGIPEEDQEAVAGPRRTRSCAPRPGKPMKWLPTLMDTGELFADYIDWRAEHPSDDIMTDLLNAEFDDEHGRHAAADAARRSSPTSPWSPAPATRRPPG